MALARYFVFEREQDWLVTLDGAPLGRHRDRSAALGSAIVMADLMGAMHHEADVMIDNGGTLEMRKDASGGEYGMCVFADNTECEEWALLRGTCAPGQTPVSK